MNIVKKIMIITLLSVSINSKLHGDITDFLLGPNDNDPRVKAIAGLGLVSAATGIYFCQKGLRGFLVGPGRIGNAVSGLISIGFIVAGVEVIASSKDIVKSWTK